MGAILFVFLTSIWVFLDAKKLGIKKGQISGFADLSPSGWFFACILIWIIAFPIYLYKRSDYKSVSNEDFQEKSLGVVEVLGSKAIYIIPIFAFSLLGIRLLLIDDFSAKNVEVLTKFIQKENFSEVYSSEDISMKNNTKNSPHIDDKNHIVEAENYLPITLSDIPLWQSKSQVSLVDFILSPKNMSTEAQYSIHLDSIRDKIVNWNILVKDVEKSGSGYKVTGYYFPLAMSKILKNLEQWDSDFLRLSKDDKKSFDFWSDPNEVSRIGYAYIFNNHVGIFSTNFQTDAEKDYISEISFVVNDSNKVLVLERGDVVLLHGIVSEIQKAMTHNNSIVKHSIFLKNVDFVTLKHIVSNSLKPEDLAQEMDLTPNKQEFIKYQMKEEHRVSVSDKNIDEPLRRSEEEQEKFYKDVLPIQLAMLEDSTKIEMCENFKKENVSSSISNESIAIAKKISTYNNAVMQKRFECMGLGYEGGIGDFDSFYGDEFDKSGSSQYDMIKGLFYAPISATRKQKNSVEKNCKSYLASATSALKDISFQINIDKNSCENTFQETSN